MNDNDIVGYLTLNNRIIKNNRPYWNCTCQLCGNKKDIREDSLKSKKVISDGCYKKTKLFSDKQKSKHPIENLTGLIFGELTVIHLSDSRNGKKIMWTCKCSCGNIVDIWAANLKNGNSKTCGDFTAHRLKYMKNVWKSSLDDLSGRKYGDWIVERRDGDIQPTRWICKCAACGKEESVLGNSLKDNSSTSCGCRKQNESLVGDIIGHWEVLERSKRLRPNGRYCTTYLCRCECGTERYVDESRLLRGKSLSCGCYSSKANEHIAKLLKEKKIKFATEYKYYDLIGPKGGYLRFDFALFDSKRKNVLCLIEYQGEQHYLDTEFGKEQREITDSQKREYCQSNNIQFYEIKYTENIDEKINEILTHYAC